MSKIGRHLRSNVVAYIALFVALGGTSAYAIDRISGSQIKNRSIAGKKLKRNAVVPKARRAAVAGRVPQLLVPNGKRVQAPRRRAQRAAAAACAAGSSGSLVKLSVGESCSVTKPPFTVSLYCSDGGNGRYTVSITKSASEAGWIDGTSTHPANEEVFHGSMTSSVPQSNLLVGPVMATPSGDAMTFGDISVGVHLLSDCWATLYGVG